MNKRVTKRVKVLKIKKKKNYIQSCYFLMHFQNILIHKSVMLEDIPMQIPKERTMFYFLL